MFNLTAKQSFWLNLIICIACSVFFVNNILYILIGGGGIMTLLSLALNGVFAYLSFQSLRTHYQRRMYPFEKLSWRNKGTGKRW